MTDSFLSNEEVDLHSTKNVKLDCR